jgi:glyoxylate utilization-related uncharacterized protein
LAKKDTQEPHSVDEVYYVIEGSDFIKLSGKDHEFRPGTCIFIPAKADHRFHRNTQDLVIFYALGGRSFHVVMSADRERENKSFDSRFYIYSNDVQLLGWIQIQISWFQ